MCSNLDVEERPLVQIKAQSSPTKILKYTNGDTLVFQFDGEVPECLDRNDVDIQLYYNGNRVFYTVYSKSADGKISGAYTVNNATLSDHGIYEVELKWKYIEECLSYYIFFHEDKYRNIERRFTVAETPAKQPTGELEKLQLECKQFG